MITEKDIEMVMDRDIYSEEESYTPTTTSNSEFEDYYSYEEEASTNTPEEDYFDPKYSETEYDEEGNTYITNNYYDDYYDYQYSSRIRRFNNCYSGYRRGIHI